LDRVAGFEPGYVTVTGGEPLAQAGCIELLAALCDAGYAVSLETSGALDIASVDSRVTRVMDIKTPGSGEVERNLYQNIENLTPDDQVKFVICDEADYDWAKDLVQREDLPARCGVLFLPEYKRQDAAELAEWILRDHLQVRFQVQLHKQLWGNVAGK